MLLPFLNTVDKLAQPFKKLVPVAQLDSAAPSLGAGRRFESALGHQ